MPPGTASQHRRVRATLHNTLTGQRVRRRAGRSLSLSLSLSLFLLSGDRLHIFRSFVMLNASLSFNSVHAVHRSGGLPLSKVLLLELGDANVKMLDSLLLSIESMQ